MNFLAHLLLSGRDPDWRAGGYLGDFIRGPLTGERPAAIEAGIRLHRHVDAVSDHHPAVLNAKRRFPAPMRRWAPVALDVLFDHFLARDFAHWQQQPLVHFTRACYTDLEARRHHLNDPARRFLDRMTEVDLLAAYAERETVSRTLSHLAQRSRHPNPLAALDPWLITLEAELLPAFETLLKDLMSHSQRWLATADDESSSRSG